MDVDDEHFEELVADALDSLPPSLGEAMENIVVMVEDWPDVEQLDGWGGTLYGLYQGIDLTQRTPLSYTGFGPDRITIFKGPICRAASNEAALVEIVSTTVIHEIAHHFGISDERLDELGWA
jgi:predicted Zn-dependent protease with MMP-like domain